MSNKDSLESFEEMLAAVQENYTKTDDKMKQLKVQGKEKTATYRHLKFTTNINIQIVPRKALRNLYKDMDNVFFFRRSCKVGEKVFFIYVTSN